MRMRCAIVSVLLSIFAGSGCFADWLVLQGGKKIETTGQWAVRGELLNIREVGGRPKSVLLSIIDYDATLQANPRVRKSTDSDWHISAEGIKLLKEAARQREAMAAQMRAQRELSAEMHSVEGKGGGAVGGSPGQAQGQKGGSQSTGGYVSRGAQGIAACRIYQDNPSKYSACLARY